MRHPCDPVAPVDDQPTRLADVDPVALVVLVLTPLDLDEGEGSDYALLTGLVRDAVLDAIGDELSALATGSSSAVT